MPGPEAHTFEDDHFHSTAHEVLGIAAGSAAVMPAGTGHRNLGPLPDQDPVQGKGGALL